MHTTALFSEIFFEMEGTIYTSPKRRKQVKGSFFFSK
ncbi:hypothetical protein Aeqsu_2422 [Aequorivita sublithincola DSM 14238]|uniref:Uncharacterized protein n=1 Tax=Aequorivita sublithincola (strain DSM 14238 / LMG 21431 / ACAM 643 / 9-3) TaxID=746697 RepID=I3YY13_AEQSU|nr:hypothetical protein Aeqsu_2422 [Aequorivita sublithincola DSM 14238]